MWGTGQTGNQVGCTGDNTMRMVATGQGDYTGSGAPVYYLCIAN